MNAVAEKVVFGSAAAVLASVGRQLGETEWMQINQERINQFAILYKGLRRTRQQKGHSAIQGSLMAALPEEMAYVPIVVEHVQLINNTSQILDYPVCG